MMKWPIFFTLLMTLSSLAFAQTELNQLDSQGKKHGKWKELYPDSNIPRYEGEFNHGKPVGKFTYYYPNKVLKSEMFFDKNPSISRCKMYDENGKLNAFGKFVNKEKDSVWTHYSPPGFVSYRESYIKGVLNGPKILYYPPEGRNSSQQVFQQFSYEKGKLQGEVKEFFPNGVLKMQGFYKNDQLHGEVKKYHPNGKIFFLERYKNGKQHGWWSTYNEQGKELAKVYFYEGKKLEGKALENAMQYMKSKGISPNSVD